MRESRTERQEFFRDDYASQAIRFVGPALVAVPRPAGKRQPYTNPAVSSKPHQRFMICTAWPLAPFTRLSSADVRMKFPVR